MQLRVITGQMPIVLDIQQNISQILTVLEKAQPNDLVVLPEGAISGYQHDLSFLASLDTMRLAEAIEHLADVVVARCVHLVVGSCVWEERQWWNAGIYFAPDRQRYMYRKINLATHERSFMSAGSALPIFPMKFKQGQVNVGIQLCREIRFPEQWRYLAMRGAELFLYLTNTANPKERTYIWRSHLISRAAENQRFLVSASVAHARQNCPTLLIAPNGEVLDEVDLGATACLRQKLDLTQNANWYLGQCRTDVLAVGSTH
ncbi:MAG: carbon-nitrogen hydrolase family protein [Ktedonobacteraceae bacterium]